MIRGVALPYRRAQEPHRRRSVRLLFLAIVLVAGFQGVSTGAEVTTARGTGTGPAQAETAVCCAAE